MFWVVWTSFGALWACSGLPCRAPGYSVLFCSGLLWTWWAVVGRWGSVLSCSKLFLAVLGLFWVAMERYGHVMVFRSCSELSCGDVGLFWPQLTIYEAFWPVLGCSEVLRACSACPLGPPGNRQ
jgi:hypothetical protein